MKIGHEIALKLLRDGATVTVTTRFPRDAVKRFSEAHDSSSWWSRLLVVGADFRSPAEVVECSDAIARRGSVDILINNAAQTVRRPESAYVLLASGEQQEAAPRLEGVIARYASLPPARPAQPAALLRADAPTSPPDALEQVTQPAVPRVVDASGLIRDTLLHNSWSKKLGEVDAMEMLEVQLCNVVAPFVLISTLMARDSDRSDRYVVNVSATEGQFSRRYKSASHPHTNMAKAALNMLTRTSADEFAQHGIYMTSVDTGWVTDERPFPLQREMAKRGFQPPLDVVDGASRIYDPIVRGCKGEPVWGILLKHYRKVRW